MQKAKVTLTISTTVEISDSGYLGGEASVDAHIKKAVAEVKRWQVLIQKPGAVEAKVVPSNLKVTSIILTEE